MVSKSQEKDYCVSSKIKVVKIVVKPIDFTIG